MMDDQGQDVKGVPSNQPSDSLALPRGKTSKCDLRKSLAWDSAFFTNDGVLDPEELSSIIEGNETIVEQNLFLPCIQEELSKSTDSISTFQSDNAALEGLEADLFSDIRASIQKSSKSSAMGNGSVFEVSGEEESRNGCAKKIVGPSSRKMAKPASSSNKLKSGVEVSVKSSNPSSAHKQVMKTPVNRSREPSSMLPRLPKAAAGRSLQDATTTKRMSVDAGRVKVDAKAAGNVKGKGASSSVGASCQVDSRKLLSKTPAVSKFSTASSVLKRKPIPKAVAVSKVSANPSVLNNRVSPQSSRSSCDSSSSCASENVRKSQTGVIRRKTDKNVNLPSGTRIRTVSTVVEKVESQNHESHLSTYLKSTSDLSPCISPASSISEWSTESSSSAATDNQKQFGFIRNSPSSQYGTVNNSAPPNLHNQSSDSTLSVHGNQVSGMFGQSSKQPSTGRPVSSPCTGFAKPSGLRMPSPNIGFFDGAKVGAKTTSSSSHSRSALQSTLPRSVAGSSSPSGVFDKTKLGINASKTTAAATGTAKPKHRVNANLKKSSAVKQIDEDTEISADTPRSNPLKSALERNDNAPEVPDVAKCFLDSQLVGEDNMASDHVSVGTSAEFLRSISSTSTLERNNEISGASRPAKDIHGLWLENDREVGLQNLPSASSELPKDNLSIAALEKVSEVAMTTDGGKQALEFASVAKDNLVASEKESSPEKNLLSRVHLGKADCSGYPSESSKSTSVDSALKKNSEVADREIQVLPDLDSAAKDDLTTTEGLVHVASDIANVASEDGSSDLIASSFLNISCATPHSSTEQSSSNSSIVYNNFSPSQQIDETINLEVVSKHKQDDEGGILEHDATDENQCSENNNLSPLLHIDKIVNLGVISQHKQQDEGESVEHGATDQNRCSEIVYNSFCSSQLIDQIDNLEIIDQHKQDGGILEYGTTDENQRSEMSQQIDGTNNLEVVSQHSHSVQDEDESMGHGATDENHCLGIGLVEINGNEAEEFNKNVGSTDDNFDTQEDSNRDVLSEPAQSARLITCSPTLPTLGDESVERTPFTIKNTASNVVEVSTSPNGSVTEAFLKVDVVAVPHQEIFRKENS